MDGLEIRNVDHVNDSDISDSKAGQVRARLDEAGLRVWSIGSPIGKIDIEKDNFAEHTEKYRRTLEIAHILGAENIRFFRKKSNVVEVVADTDSSYHGATKNHA